MQSADATADLPVHDGTQRVSQLQIEAGQLPDVSIGDRSDAELFGRGFDSECAVLVSVRAFGVRGGVCGGRNRDA